MSPLNGTGQSGVCVMGAYNEKWRETEETETHTAWRRAEEGRSRTGIQCIYWCLKMKVEKCIRGCLLFLPYLNLQYV